ncbi:MAG: UTP--glucose-1-phosphate uridylyltransferase [Thermoleophilia bacterium]
MPERPAPDLDAFAARMRAEGLPDVVVRTFAAQLDQLARGETGLIPEAELEPVESLPDLDALGDEAAAAGREALPRTVLVKLNGGLGTSMGLERAKSLLPVKDGLTFLDVIARQARDAGVPLVLMNSFATRDDSLALLAGYPELAGPIPLDFVQHKVPKVERATLAPATAPGAPELEWNPPGHGDLYAALVTSGTLDALRTGGYRYAFVSNADNLGAVLDERLLGHLVANGLPFLMEVADRTAADRKGGHLARLADGRLVLRESAQCPAEDEDAFQDVERHRYFNTNSIWLDLDALAATLAERDGVLGLPMIRNEKTVDPRDPGSTPVYQLETAIGSAIQVFPGAGAIRVPRTRFAPVKTTSDLLAVRSDAYVLTADWRVVGSPARTLGTLVVDLDPRFYRLVDQLDARFPAGPPSLVACERLRVRGDVRFGAGVVARGDVLVAHEGDGQAAVPDGASLAGELAL